MAPGLKYVQQFSELQAYNRQRALSREIFRVTQSFPKEERFSLTDQVRRSGRSIGAQIAEAWAKRRYPKHFISKLTDADGEQMETQHWLHEALDCGYLIPAEHERLPGLCQEVGRMLGSLIHKADAFSSDSYTLQDDAIPYLAYELPDAEY